MWRISRSTPTSDGLARRGYGGRASRRNDKRRALARGLSGPLTPPGFPHRHRRGGRRGPTSGTWPSGVVSPTVRRRSADKAVNPPVAIPARRRAGGFGGRGGGAPRQPPCYTRGMRITRGQNHGRRSRKFNRDCTIRHPCLSTRSDSDVSGWRVKSNRLAGISNAVQRVR